MKKMNVKAFLVFCTILAVSIIACEQLDNDMKHVVNQEKSKLVDEDAIDFDLLARKHVVIRCDNSCQDIMASCQAFYTSQKVFRCQCSGCTMVVEERSSLGFASKASDEHTKIAMEILNDEIYYELLVETVESNYPGEDFMLSEFHTIFTEDKIFIQYYYSTIKDNNGTLSIEIERKGPEKRYVCTGSCDNNVVCRETYEPHSGGFGCDGCSDCKGSEVDAGHRPNILRNF